MTTDPGPLHVTLVATPDAQVSPLSGLFETFNSFGLLAAFEPDLPALPFEVEIVAPDADAALAGSGLTLGSQRSHEEIERTDIAIIPLMMVQGPDWVKGRYPHPVEWLCRLHQNGACLASACTGVLLLAETGLLDGREATIHWAFAPTFRRNFPNIRLRTEEVLITAGARQEFVMTGGVMSWHDLALHLIAKDACSNGVPGSRRERTGGSFRFCLSRRLSWTVPTRRKFLPDFSQHRRRQCR